MSELVKEVADALSNEYWRIPGKNLYQRQAQSAIDVIKAKLLSDDTISKEAERYIIAKLGGE